MLASSTESKRESHNQGNQEERGKENTNQRSSHDAG
jgi:hypothetical protein